jgi:hypothetical protein
MQVTVYMLAFGDIVPVPERIVDIPDEKFVDLCVEAHSTMVPATIESLLDLAYYYGQNDFQPKPIRSVSVGDVIKLPSGALHKVLNVGFEALPAGTNINTLPRGRDASFC